MNKSELAASIAARTNLELQDAEAAVNAFVEVVTEELKQDGRVAIMGFGAFEVAEHPERPGFNPRANKPITIPAGKAPKFRPGKTLREAVKGADPQ